MGQIFVQKNLFLKNTRTKMTVSADIPYALNVKAEPNRVYGSRCLQSSALEPVSIPNAAAARKYLNGYSAVFLFFFLIIRAKNSCISPSGHKSEQ